MMKNGLRRLRFALIVWGVEQNIGRNVIPVNQVGNITCHAQPVMVNMKLKLIILNFVKLIIAKTMLLTNVMVFFAPAMVGFVKFIGKKKILDLVIMDLHALIVGKKLVVGDINQPK
tara:strand:+ start:2743 stop:3090 length:348 start_codon:yes stop_codon:yes gene_type:complete